MTHPGELTLRRLVAEEPIDPQISAHVGSCTDCNAKIERLKAEQTAFEATIPFDRFAAGVERAGRAAASKPVARSWAPFVVVALAAVWLVGVTAFIAYGHSQMDRSSDSRIKGGPTATFVVAASNGLQREAGDTERLAAGERVRIGVKGGPYVTALSIDDQGAISTLYSEVLKDTFNSTWLPDALEFTGDGSEHVVVVLSDEPIDDAKIGASLSREFQAAKGDLLHLGALDTPGVQIHRTFIKP